MHSATILLLHPLDGGYEPQCFSSRRRGIRNSIIKQIKIRVATLLVCIAIACFGKAQQSGVTNNNFSDSTLTALQGLPSKYYASVDKKINYVNDRLTRKTLKYLRKFQRQEAKLQKRMQQLNPAAAINKADATYNNFTQKIKSKTGIFGKAFSGLYNPYLDTLGSSLSFLKQVKDIGAQADAPLQSFNDLESKMQQADDINAFIAERKNQLQQSLSQISNLTPGLKREYDKLNKTAYYYSAELNQYKDMLHDPDKLEQKALSILSRLPAFQKFMKDNSQIAGLFSIPANYSTPQALQGLQTIDQVQQMIASRIGSGPNATQMLQSQMQDAIGQLNKFKDKLNQLGSSSGDIEMPDFTPNNEKTKPFLKRLEYGSDLQTTRGSYGFPTTTDLGLSVGYKLNNKGTVGIGASYKAGWGTDISHIHFTSEGMGLRSYFEYNLKKTFYATGGWEYNYQPSLVSQSLAPGTSAWQQSGLIGISKTVDIKSKLFRKTKVQVLWDFMSYYQIPKSQAIKFRVGYDF